MMRKELDQWAQRFSADLGTEGGRAPFDRIVRHHYLEIQRLLDAHLTFPTLAAALTRAGAARANGRPYSPDQLYMAVRRAASPPNVRPDLVSERNNRASSRTAKSSAAKESHLADGAAETTIHKGVKPASAVDANPSNSHEFVQHSDTIPSNPTTPKELTDEDVSAALRRIRKSN